MDKALISRLEKLARLQLHDDERAKLAGDLTRILEMVDKLRALDTTGIEPLIYPSETQLPPREDGAGEQLSTAAALQNAPRHDDQYFRVPKVIE